MKVSLFTKLFREMYPQPSEQWYKTMQVRVKNEIEEGKRLEREEQKRMEYQRQYMYE